MVYDLKGKKNSLEQYYSIEICVRYIFEPCVYFQVLQWAHFKKSRREMNFNDILFSLICPKCYNPNMVATLASNDIFYTLSFILLLELQRIFYTSSRSQPTLATYQMFNSHCGQWLPCWMAQLYRKSRCSGTDVRNLRKVLPPRVMQFFHKESSSSFK